MMRKKLKAPIDRPDVATTYAELKEMVNAFAGGNVRLLVILGSPGISKSVTVRGSDVSTRFGW